MQEIGKKEGRSFNLREYTDAYSCNIITNIITGRTYASDDPEFRHLIDSIYKGLSLIGPALLFSFSPYLAMLPSKTKNEIFKNLRGSAEFTKKAIKKHKDVFAPSNDSSKDFMDAYLMEMAKRERQVKWNSLFRQFIPIIILSFYL